MALKYTLGIKDKPYNLFLLVAALLLLATLFVGYSALDIHLHDTYIVVANSHIYWGMAFIAILFWVMYKLTDKFLLSKNLHGFISLSQF